MACSTALGLTKDAFINFAPWAARSYLPNRLSWINKEQALKEAIASTVATAVIDTYLNLVAPKLPNSPLFNPIQSLSDRIEAMPQGAIAALGFIGFPSVYMAIEFSVKRLSNPWKVVSFLSCINVIFSSAIFYGIKQSLNNTLENLDKEIGEATAADHQQSAVHQQHLKDLQSNKDQVGSTLQSVNTMTQAHFSASAFFEGFIAFLGNCLLEKRGYTAFYPLVYTNTTGLNRMALKHAAISCIVTTIAQAISDQVTCRLPRYHQQ